MLVCSFSQAVLLFLADRTAARTVIGYLACCRLSVRPSVIRFSVAKRCMLPRKCLNRWP